MDNCANQEASLLTFFLYITSLNVENQKYDSSNSNITELKRIDRYFKKPVP